MYTLLRECVFCFFQTVFFLSEHSQICAEEIVFDLTIERSHQNTILNCRHSQPSDISWKEFCGVWAIKTAHSGTSYVRIDEIGQIDYTTVTPELACRVSRPLDLSQRAENGQLNFDLLIQGWKMDWDRYFDPSSEFKCYFCNHCKYNGFDSFWSQKQIESYSNRYFSSQQEVTRLCGGDETGKVNGVPPASILVKSYNVRIHGSEPENGPITWTACVSRFGKRCFGFQSARTVCEGSGYCRKYPPDYRIQECLSEWSSRCTPQDGDWGEWSSYFPESCPSDKSVCHTSPRCRMRACNGTFRYPPNSRCAFGQHIEVDYCYKDCSALKSLIPLLKLGAAVLLGAILVSIIYIICAKDSDSSKLTEVEIKKGSKRFSNVKLGRRSASKVGSQADVDEEDERFDMKSDAGSVASLSKLSRSKKSRRSSKKTNSKQRHSKTKN